MRPLDWLLPPRCGGCRRLGGWLCDRCRGACRRLEEPLCPRCGAELASAGSYCGCRRRLRALSRVRSAAAYSGPLERAIHRFKYEGWRPLAAPLAALILDRVAVTGLAGEVLVAVPLHSSRRRRRGYNQSDLLVRELQARLRLPKAPGHLRRIRATPPQVGQDRIRRFENVRDAFEWRGPYLAGRPVLLVDDVTTTGATLEACASALRAAGAGSVTGLTVARVAL